MLTLLSVRVNNVPETIWRTPVVESWNEGTKEMPFVIAEGEGEAEITLTFSSPVKSAVIRPRHLGILPELREGSIVFRARPGMKVSVEPEGRQENAVGVFYSLPVPRPENTTHSFGPGVHSVGVLRLGDGDTLYLEKGAYLKAKLFLAGRHITVCGSGILSGEALTREEEQNMIETQSCEDLSISGITLIRSFRWNMRLSGIDRGEIADVKIIGYRSNNDGVDVCGSRDIHVHDCFIRSTDDCLAVKGFNTGDVRNVLFECCTLWNNYANPMRVGGIRADRAENITFREMDIIHDNAGYPLFAVLEGNRAHIRNLTVTDIRAEQIRNSHLFDIRIQRNLWNTDPHAGPMENLTFRNITVGEGETPEALPQESVLRGWNDECEIDGVTFENIRLYGKQMTSLRDCRIRVREHVRNVRFLYDGEETKPVLLRCGLRDMEYADNGRYSGLLELRAENTDTVSRSLTLLPRLAPSPEPCASPSVSLTLSPGEVRVVTFPVTLPAGNYALWADSADVHTRTEYTFHRLSQPLTELEPEKLTKMPHLPVTDADGTVVSELALSRMGEALYCHARLRCDRDCGDIPGLSLYLCPRPVLRRGDALFSAPETCCGRAPALTYDPAGPVTEPIMRNYAEITYTLNNAPAYDKLIRIRALRDGTTEKTVLRKVMEPFETGARAAVRETVCEVPSAVLSSVTSDGWTELLLRFSPELLEVSPEERMCEIEVFPALSRRVSVYSLTLYKSLSPAESVHMYADMRNV